jgi:hypothetical protein
MRLCRYYRSPSYRFISDTGRGWRIIPHKERPVKRCGILYHDRVSCSREDSTVILMRTADLPLEPAAQPTNLPEQGLSVAANDILHEGHHGERDEVIRGLVICLATHKML